MTIDNPNDVFLFGEQRVSQRLDLVNGILHTGANKIIVDANANLFSSTSSWVSGNMQHNFSGSGIKNFFIGDNLHRSPISLNVNVVTPGGIIAHTIAGDHLNIGSSTIDSTKTNNRTCTLENAGITFSDYNATISWDGTEVDAGAVSDNFISAQYDGST